MYFRDAYQTTSPCLPFSLKGYIGKQHDQVLRSKFWFVVIKFPSTSQKWKSCGLLLEHTLYVISCKPKDKLAKAAYGMMEGELLDTLVKCLQDHDTTIERADLQAALAGENGAAIEIWTKEYLGAETILTKDELSL